MEDIITEHLLHLHETLIIVTLVTHIGQDQHADLHVRHIPADLHDHLIDMGDDKNNNYFYKLKLTDFVKSK
jgi:hypothetical protein